MSLHEVRSIHLPAMCCLPHSGGLPWTQPQLADRMARAALADAANGCVSLIVTEAPGCLAHLRANAGEGVEVRGLYELLAEHLEA